MVSAVGSFQLSERLTLRRKIAKVHLDVESSRLSLLIILHIELVRVLAWRFLFAFAPLRENQFQNRCREGDRPILLRDHRGGGALRKMRQSPAVLKLVLKLIRHGQ